MCTTTLACTTLGSSLAMFTIVMDVKTMTQSVPISNLNIVNEASAGQGSLPAKFIDREQVAVQELMVFKRVPTQNLTAIITINKNLFRIVVHNEISYIVKQHIDAYTKYLLSDI